LVIREERAPFFTAFASAAERDFVPSASFNSVSRACGPKTALNILSGIKRDGVSRRRVAGGDVKALSQKFPVSAKKNRRTHHC